MNKRWLGTALCVALVGLSGCAEDGPAVTAEDAVLVEIGQTAIRVADYRQFIARVAPEFRAEYGAEKLLEAIVEQTLLVQEAERRGLSESAEFVQWQAQAQARLVQQALYERAGIVQPEVAEEELRAYFQRSPYNRRVRFSLLMVREQEQLPEILAALAEGADFEELSMGHSQDSRILERQADMGYHRWGDTMASHAALTERAFSMQVGEVSEPMQVADGYFIIKLTDMHPVSFEQEQETIQRLVMREKLGRQLLAYYDTLHVRYNVRYEPDGLTADRSPEAVVAEYDGGVLTVAQARELLKGQGAGRERCCGARSGGAYWFRSKPRGSRSPMTRTAARVGATAADAACAALAGRAASAGATAQSQRPEPVLRGAQAPLYRTGRGGGAPAPRPRRGRGHRHCRADARRSRYD